MYLQELLDGSITSLRRDVRLEVGLGTGAARPGCILNDALMRLNSAVVAARLLKVAAVSCRKCKSRTAKYKAPARRTNIFRFILGE